jgi:hypothetical protein
MSGTNADYGGSQDESSDAWARVERFREYQLQRMLAVNLGDIYLGLARAYVRLGGRNTSRACGLLVAACEHYQFAGLSRRGQAAWRLAQWFHAGRFREVTR